MRGDTTTDTEELLNDIRDDQSKAVQVDRDGLLAWVRWRGGFEVYSRTEGFLQDRLFETSESDVVSKIEEHGGKIVPETNAPFDLDT